MDSKNNRNTTEYKQNKTVDQKEVWSDLKLRKKHSIIIKEQYKNGRIPWNKGKKLKPRSEETKRKISETLKNKYKNNGHS